MLQQALQDEIGDLADLPGVLRQRDEQVRAGQRAIRTTPAHQGFGTDTAAAGELENWLVEHLQLATTQRPLKLHTHRATLSNQL
ncbi:hypothetical protein D3C79_1046670 [compost metagenome]